MINDLPSLLFHHLDLLDQARIHLRLILLSEERVTKDDLLERRKLRRRVGEVERLDKEEVRSRDVLGRRPRAELDDVSGRREDRSWRSWSDGGVSEEEGVKMWEDEERVYCPRQRDSFEESDVVDAQGLEYYSRYVPVG